MDEKEQMYKELLEMVYESVQDIVNKEYERLWKYDLTIPLSLKDALKGLTKDELTKIRQNLNLKGLSTLNKKELIDRITPLISTNLKKILYTFDEERYNLLKKIIANGGYIKVDDMDFGKFNHFRDYGIAFTGWKDDDMILAMPVEIIEAFKGYDNHEYRKIVERNTIWIHLIKGMLYYYGVMDLEYITKKLEEYTREKCDFIEVLNVIYSASECHIQISAGVVGFKDFRVMDEIKIRDEQKAREDIPYYNFTKKEILRASNENYIEKTPQTNKFTRYLKTNYDIGNEEIDEFLNIINFMINNGDSIGEIITRLQENFEMDSLEQIHLISTFLMDIHNNTRLWILKGHTPNEAVKMHESHEKDKTNIIDMKSRKKIGRNDPCPCGSGKKYKRCCGK